MNSTALVPVFAGTLQNQPTQLCNARDLHTTLAVGRDFTSWLKERIEQYSFTEGEDFILCSPDLGSKRRGGHNRTDYHLTLDMAKELAMVENNEIGRKVRRYFIALEKTPARVGTGDTVKALPSPDKLTKNLRQRINRKAHEIALKQYDTIHAFISIWARDNLDSGATEEDCERYIETAGELADGTVLINIRDAQELVSAVGQVIDTAGSTIATIKRIEQRSGYDFYHRFPRSKSLPPGFHKHDRLVQETIDRIVGDPA